MLPCNDLPPPTHVRLITRQPHSTIILTAAAHLLPLPASKPGSSADTNRGLALTSYGRVAHLPPE